MEHRKGFRQRKAGRRADPRGTFTPAIRQPSRIGRLAAVGQPRRNFSASFFAGFLLLFVVEMLA